MRANSLAKIVRTPLVILLGLILVLGSCSRRMPHGTSGSLVAATTEGDFVILDYAIVRIYQEGGSAMLDVKVTNRASSLVEGCVIGMSLYDAGRKRLGDARTQLRNLIPRRPQVVWISFQGVNPDEIAASSARLEAVFLSRKVQGVRAYSSVTPASFITQSGVLGSP